MKPYLLQSCKYLLLTACFLNSYTNITAQTKTRVTGAANWNTNSTWVKTLSGGVTCLLISKTVLGLGTSFTTELSPGDVLTTISGQQIGTVATITNDASLQLVGNASILLTLFTSYGSEKVPTALDDVEIGNTALGTAVTVTLDAASATVNSLTFIADNLNNTLTHSGTNALTVNNAVTINQPTAASRTIAWNINGGTATVSGNLSFAGSNATASRVGKIVITSGTLNANGGISFAGATAATKLIDMSGGAGSLNLKGALTVPASSATLTAGTSGSIFNYTGNTAQSINYFPAGKYNNLHINNTSAGGASLSNAITTANVEGNLSVGNINTGSLFKTGNYAVALNNSKTVTIASASTLDAGTSTISFGTGTPNLTINGTFKTAQANGFSGTPGAAINSTYPPTFILGSNSTVEYNSAGNQVVTGRTDYANIIASGGAIKTADGEITARTSLSIGNATTFDAATFIHYMRGSLSCTGTFIANTSTMNFSGTGAQGIPGVTYNNLQTSNGGTKTAVAGLTVAGNLIIGSGTLFSASTFTHNIAGNFTNNGNFTAGTSTIHFNGTSNQVVTGVSSFHHVTLNSSADLQIANAITINGALTLTDGLFDINDQTLTLNGSFSGDVVNALKGTQASNLVIGSSFNSAGQSIYFDQSTGTDNNYIRNLTLNNSIDLGNKLNIAGGASAGSITIATGVTLSTNDHLSLKSNATGTARLAALPVDGSGNATAYITGKVNIERFVPAARGWRLLSAPVKASGGPTINETWQEGLTTASVNPDLYPGFGVKICGGSSANGYDTSSTPNTFIKIYNNATNSFTALPASPGTNIPISTYPGYFLYIRGDRSVDMLQGLSAAVTTALMRTKGQVKTGNQIINVNSTNYTLLGNPYPSAIDFHSLTKSNVNDVIYIWDPKLAGTYGIGGYVTLSWNSGTLSYDATASVSNVSQYIPSGEAVLIESADHINPGTITIKESDKTTNGCDQVFRANGLDQKLRVNLYLANTDSTSSLLDGVLTTYDDDNMNAVDNNDAKKINGSNQSIGIKRAGKMLAIERRKTITETDSIFLNIFQMKVQQYKLEIVIDNMDNTGMIAILKDSYSNTTDNFPLQMNGTTNVPFIITADPASYATGRFSIVFVPMAPVPVTITRVNAYQQETNIAVEWQTENETNMRHYEVERSVDGTGFIKINNSPVPALNNGSGNYQFIDNRPVKGINYYRVVSVSNEAAKKYSNIVKVNIKAMENEPAISIYPNPVAGNTIHLELTNIETGIYHLQLFNSAGQSLLVKTIKQQEVSPSGSFDVNCKFPPGTYQLRLTGNGLNLKTAFIKQ